MRAATGNTNAAAERGLLGKPAPDAILSTPSVERMALSAFITGPTALLRWNPGCGFCQRMLDDLKAIEADPPAGTPRIVVISSGNPERDITPSSIHGLIPGSYTPTPTPTPGS